MAKFLNNEVNKQITAVFGCLDGRRPHQMYLKSNWKDSVYDTFDFPADILNY